MSRKKMLPCKRHLLFCWFMYSIISSHIAVCQDKNTMLLYADMVSIKLLDVLSKSQIEVHVLGGQSDIVSLDYHATQNYIYWSDSTTNRVSRLHFPVSFDDTTIEEIISPRESPKIIAVDSLYDHLYWTKDEGEGGGSVMRSELDGSNATVIVDTRNTPKALALDIQKGWIYFETDFGTLTRCQLDGSNEQTIVSSKVDYIALDLFHERLYWCDAHPFVIQSAYKNGSDVQRIVTGLSFLTTDIDHETIYFSDRQQGIFLMSKDNGSSPVLVHAQNQVYGIKVYRRYNGVMRLGGISSNGVLNENGTGKFICSATFVGNIENAAISWRLNNATINPTLNSRWKTETLPQDPQNPGTIQYQLTVNPLLIRDTGTISCHINYEDLLYERKLQVAVSEMPVVSISPRRKIAPRGDTVIIDCTIINAPTDLPSSTYSSHAPTDSPSSFLIQKNGLDNYKDSTIVWYKNGFPLETRQADCSNGVFDRLTVIDIHNSTVYECAGKNSVGEGRKVSSTITVLNTNIDYNFCEGYTDANNITWIRTVEGVVAEIPCTSIYTGVVSRLCNTQGDWEEPDYSSCVRKDFLYLNEKSEILKEGIEESDVNTLLQTQDSLITENDTELTSVDLEVSSSILNNIAEYISERTHALSPHQIAVVVNISNNLLEDRNIPIWDQLKRLNLNGITRTVKALTTYTKAYASANSDEFNIYLQRDNLVVAVGRTTSNELIFPDRSQELPPWLINSTTRVKLHSEILSDNGLKAVGYSGIYYRNISSLFHHHIISNGTMESIEGISEVNSVVVNFWISTSLRKLDSDPPLVIEFQHLNESFSNPLCVFWNFNVSDSPYGAWSAVGSRLLKSTNLITTCGYDHTTNFAILMSPGNTPSKHLLALSVLSIFGCGMSILCLIITVVVYVYLWRYLKSDRSVILVNLCVALAFSYTLFLVGVTRTENEDACTAIAVALHYIFLVDFSLMLAEGIEIGFSILLVFRSGPKAKWLVPVSWCIPAVIVAISAGVTKLQGYGNKDKAGIRSMFVILPLFGITWVLGIFSINEDVVIFQYLFAMANSLQGFMIFIFHCFLNKRVREGIQHIKRKRSTRYVDSKVTSQSQSKLQHSSTTKQTFDNGLYMDERDLKRKI